MTEKSFTMVREIHHDKMGPTDDLAEPITLVDILELVVKEHQTFGKDVWIRFENERTTIDSLGLFHSQIVFPSFAEPNDLSDAEPLVIRCKLWVIAEKLELPEKANPEPQLPERIESMDSASVTITTLWTTINGVIDYLEYLKNKEKE